MKLVEKQLLGHLGNIKQFFWVSLVYITIIIYDYMIVSNHGQKLGLAPSGLGMGIVAMWVVWETQMALIWTMKSGSCVGFTTHPPTINRWETNLTLISYGFLCFHAVSDQFHGILDPGPIRVLIGFMFHHMDWGRKTLPSINGLRENLQENMVFPWNMMECVGFL